MKKLTGTLYRAGETAATYSEGNDYEVLAPAAYICSITDIVDNVDKDYLEIYYDICEGEHAGYYQRVFDRADFWGGVFRAYYTEKAKGTIFAKILKAINISNEGYEFNPFEDGSNADEKTLLGKKFGMVIHEEEYTKRDGSLGCVLRGQSIGVISVNAAKEGKFSKKLLERKSIETTDTTGRDGFVQVKKEEIEGILFQ